MALAALVQLLFNPASPAIATTAVTAATAAAVTSPHQPIPMTTLLSRLVGREGSAASAEALKYVMRFLFRSSKIKVNALIRFLTETKLRVALTVLGLGTLTHSLSTRKKRLKAREFIRSSVYAVSSGSVRNMLLAALLLTVASVKGLKLKRTRGVFSTFFILVWGFYYYFRIIEHGVARYQRTFWNVHIVEKAQLTRLRYRPVFWACNRHAQTIVCFVLAHLEWLWSTKIHTRTEAIRGEDGNKQYIEWLFLDKGETPWEKDLTDHLEPDEADLDGEESPKPRVRRPQSMKQLANVECQRQFTGDSPIVLLVHGFGDDNEHPYMKRFTRMCRNHGWRAVSWSYWRWDFGNTTDLSLVITHLHNTYPRAPIITIAWSAGGHLLLKYLGTVGKHTPVVAAICVSGCYDFFQVSKDIRANQNPSYKYFLGLQARQCAKRHLLEDVHMDPEPVRKLLKIAEIGEPAFLYDRFLALQGAYSGCGGPDAHREHADEINEDEYQDPSMPYKLEACPRHYAESAISVVEGVKICTLMLHARDDPVVAFKHIDWDRVVENKHIIVLHTKRGGHVSWYEKLLPFGWTWADRVASNFISVLLETHAHTNFLITVLRRSMEEQPHSRRPLNPEALARIVSASDLALRVKR